MTRPTAPLLALGLASSTALFTSPALACELDLPVEPTPPVVLQPLPPPQVVIVRPWSAPPPPPVVVRAVPAAVVVRPVLVSRPTPLVVEQEPVEVTQDVDGGTFDDRGTTVRQARRVVVGGGYGGLVFAGPDSSTLASAFGVHLGLALAQASVGLRLAFAPDAIEVAKDRSASYAIGGLGFGYHFNAESLIHPVVGASLDLHALDPEQDEALFGFGLGARAGLEMEYPLDSGSLGIGVDVSAHHRFGAEDAMPIASNAIGFGGTLDYRF